MAEKGLIIAKQYGIRRLLAETLKNEGYFTFETEEISEISKTLTKHQIDFILLDIDKPVTSGLALLMKIKYVRPQTKVFVIGTFGKTRLIEEAFELGAAAYFAKPFDIDHVCKVVRRELQTIQFNEEIQQKSMSS